MACVAALAQTLSRACACVKALVPSLGRVGLPGRRLDESGPNWVRRIVKRLTVIVAVALLSGTALLVPHGRATASAPANHQCPPVSSLDGFAHGAAIRILTRDVSCAEVLVVVPAKESNMGVDLQRQSRQRGQLPLEALRFARLDMLRRRQRLPRRRGRRDLRKGQRHRRVVSRLDQRPN
jgi:hypothetical protein